MNQHLQGWSKRRNSSFPGSGRRARRLAAAGHFDELVHGLRNSPEWHFVSREIDIRLVRAAP